MSGIIFSLGIYVAALISILVAVISIRSGATVFAAYLRGSLAFYTFIFLGWLCNKLMADNDEREEILHRLQMQNLAKNQKSSSATMEEQDNSQIITNATSTGESE